jgi:hypothetical protein
MSLKMGISGKYVSVLSKETDCTYSHTVKLLDEFRNLGLVEFEKKGRVKFIKLTADGEELAGHFESVLRKFTKLKPKRVEKEKPVQKEVKKPQPLPTKHAVAPKQVPQVIQTKPTITKPAPPKPQEKKKQVGPSPPVPTSK